MENVRILSKHFATGFYALVDPIGKLLAAINVHPHAVTIAGLFFSIISGLLFWKGYFALAGLAIIISGACDVIDGRLARNTQRMSTFGALFDSTVDRYSEIAVFMGLAAFFIDKKEDPVYITLLIILAIGGSLLTSYARARAEGLGIECKIGLMQRPERITFLATAAILGGLGFGELRSERIHLCLVRGVRFERGQLGGHLIALGLQGGELLQLDHLGLRSLNRGFCRFGCGRFLEDRRQALPKGFWNLYGFHRHCYLLNGI